MLRRLLQRLIYIELDVTAEHSYLADRATRTSDERIFPPINLANGDKISFKPTVEKHVRVPRFARSVDVKITFAERVPSVVGEIEIRRANFIYECAYCAAKIGINHEYAYVPTPGGYAIYCSPEHAKIGEGIGVRARRA